VVCTRSGTTDFALHEGNALVSWRNPWSLRRAIRRLIEDRALRERLSAAGPASAAPWSWDRLAVRLLEQLGQDAR
jgi:glycosyltransferase involved in cell wall biosynthesis